MTNCCAAYSRACTTRNRHTCFPPSADVLGQVYEQFLGKVIRLTEGHHAKVEDKPEVKKAGGVYYTPTYIVEYIVENTVGKLLEGKTPKQAASLRILDPACGSGSFLLGAYEYLLQWHLKFYTESDSTKWAKGSKPALVQTSGGAWKETQQTLQPVLLTFQERALPDLGDNIKCGNSLIGPDFYRQQLLPLGEEENYRINVFDWKKEFPEIFKAGGFDAVIGNPPYVDIKTLPEVDAEYIYSNYPCANNRINLFAAFIEKALLVLRLERNQFSMIVPTAVLTQESYQALRRKILSETRIVKVVRLPNESFGAAAGDVKVDTVILVLSEKAKGRFPVEIIGYSGYDRITKIDAAEAKIWTQIEPSVWETAEDCVWSITTGANEDLILRKCEKGSIPLEQCADFSLGLTPYDKYKGHTENQIVGRVFHPDTKKNETFKKLLAGNDVSRYYVKWNRAEWISYGPWLGASRERRFFTEPRILVKQIIDWTTKRIWASITNEELYNTQNAFNLLARDGWSLEYLLAILNSRLMTFYHTKKFLDEFKMRFQKILIKDARRFPIHKIESNKRDDQSRHDQLVRLVNQMLGLHKSLAAAKAPQEKTSLERQIAATDAQIDRLVYDLYGLTPEEIKIVEASTAAK